ncbi:MAG: sugar kinase [Bacteroidota bacterium]
MDHALRTIDCVAIGEILVDMISKEYVDSLDGATEFSLKVGGSPANMAGNLARLGRRVEFIGTVGDDGAGKLIRSELSKVGVDLQYLSTDVRPSSLILVTKSHNLPAFSAYRSADVQIVTDQFAKLNFAQVRLLHTTAFGLSKEPARSSILNAAKEARALGVQLSIDANYAKKIWPDRQEAQSIIEHYLSLGALAKFSEVDFERLYDRKVVDPEEVGRELLTKGASLVCLTLGEAGAYIFTADTSHHIPSRKLNVVDTTGAGDAFWAGFLHGWLSDEKDLEKCGLTGRRLAEMKLTTHGPLPNRINLVSD